MSFITARDNSPATESLDQKVKNSSKERILNSPEFRDSEIQNVSNYDFRFIPKGVSLEQKEIEDLRALSSLSRIKLTPPSQISSHRPVVGKIIVLIKKLSYPLVAFHLKSTIEAMEEFASRFVASHAKALVEIQELKSQKQTR